MALTFLQAASPAHGIATFAPFILIFAVFYLFMIRPGQKRQKTWQAMLSGLKSGDQVVTTGGIRGRVITVKDDLVVISVRPDNIRMEVAKSAIASVTTAEIEPKA